MKTIYYFYDQVLNAEKIPDNEMSLLHGLLQAYLPKISKYFPRHVSGLFTTVCEHTDVAKTLLKQKDIQAVIDIINEKFKHASDIKDEYFRSLLEVFLSNYPQYIALIPVARIYDSKINTVIIKSNPRKMAIYDPKTCTRRSEHHRKNIGTCR